ERPLARQLEHRAGLDLRLLVGRVVGHVLALAGLAGAIEDEHRRHALEPRGHHARQAFEAVPVDLQLQSRNRVIERHGAPTYTPRPRCWTLSGSCWGSKWWAWRPRR